MTTNKYIDLNTPEADRQPRARCKALPSHVAAEALPIDLTADTPPPVSARGIADDENVRRGGDDAHNDFDRPPYLPCLHKTRENTRSNTPHSRAFTPLSAPVTNSSSSPRKKKSRSSQRRYSGKENSTSDISAINSPPVENRKSPFMPPVLENRKAPLYLLPKPTPREVVDLAGKNSPVALSVSRVDSDTLSVSRLDSVQVPIPAVTNSFGGPREIPRKKKMVSFLVDFFPRYLSLRITPGEMTLGGQVLLGAHHQHTRIGGITYSIEFGYLLGWIHPKSPTTQKVQYCEVS